MIILMFGPPASGKGTQGRLLSEKLGFFYISSGELFREIAKERSDIAQVLNRGDLLDDDLVMELMTKYFEEKKLFDNIILDGGVRSIYQYEKFNNWLKSKGKKIDLAIYLNISDEEVVKRQSARRTDRLTGKVYNLITNPPPADLNPQNLTQREDDKPEAIAVRLQKYHAVTEPLVKLLKREGILLEIDGSPSIDFVHKDLVEKFEARMA